MFLPEIQSQNQIKSDHDFSTHLKQKKNTLVDGVKFNIMPLKNKPLLHRKLVIESWFAGKVRSHCYCQNSLSHPLFGSAFSLMKSLCQDDLMSDSSKMVEA